jgi:hypothetical protein
LINIRAINAFFSSARLIVPEGVDVPGGSPDADVVRARGAFATIIPRRKEVVEAPEFVDDGGLNGAIVGRSFG